MDIDFAIPGNHDLDFGIETFEGLIETINTKWVLSNLELK